MLGLGNSLVNGGAPQQGFDQEWLFESSADVTPWSGGANIYITSLSYESSTSFGGVAYSDLMKVTVDQLSSSQSCVINLPNALPTSQVKAGTNLRWEIDFGLTFKNDNLLRIIAIQLGGTLGVVQASDVSANAFYTLAATSSVAMGSTNQDIRLLFSSDVDVANGGNAVQDSIQIKRIRVYEG